MRQVLLILYKGIKTFLGFTVKPNLNDPLVKRNLIQGHGKYFPKRISNPIKKLIKKVYFIFSYLTVFALLLSYVVHHYIFIILSVLYFYSLFAFLFFIRCLPWCEGTQHLLMMCLSGLHPTHNFVQIQYII